MQITHQFRQRFRWWWSRIGLLIGLIAIIGLFIFFALTSQQTSSLPRTPEPENGRTIPMSSHNVVVYLTDYESTQRILLERTSVALLITSVLMFGVYKLKLEEWN